jgi:DNA ligase (NAD+)
MEDSQMELKELRTKLIEANKAYRTGHPIISDYEYDNLVDDLSEQNPHDELLLKVGHIDEKDSRKEKLPIEMASMNKCKTVEELKKWAKLKELPKNTEFVLTPKYDGASLCVVEEKQMAFTRGNGILGQRSDIHLKALSPSKQTKLPPYLVTVGEVILPVKKWGKYSETYANPRNMVSGQLNSDVPGSELEDCVYMRYGTDQEVMSKALQLDLCNKLNSIKVPYMLNTLNNITEAYLKDLFEEWKKDFQIDGIIVEVNDSNLRQSLGRERSGNPAYARAYKGNFEEVKETEVLDVEWNVSKQGFLKPVGHVRKTNLDGANVTNVTLFNAKFVETMGIGPGAKIMIKRSGQVIPFVISVTKTANNNLPSVCPSCKEKVEWNENCVELICTNDDCTSKRLNKIISFFDIMGVENVGEGIFTQLYETGYDTVAKILNMKESDFRKLEGFGDRKAEIAYNAIHDKMQNVVLSKLQHASGCFKLLGSKKLILLEEFYYDSYVGMVDIAGKVQGFAEKSAEDYVQGIKKFKEFIKNLPITIKKENKMELLENRLVGQSFCITGTLSQPRAYFEELIQNYGGVVKGVSSKLNYLVVGTDPGSKVQKADNGFTRIINESEFMELIG